MKTKLCVSAVVQQSPPPNKEKNISDDTPVVEGAWPEQQPTRNGYQVLFFGLGEASTEVEGQDDEEGNIPGIAKEAAVIDRPGIKLVKM